MHNQLKQQGFTLYIVLVLMAIIAILVLAGGQTLNTEMRMSSNDADRKYAFGLAEDALRSGENYVLEKIHPDVLANNQIASTLNELEPQADVFFNAMMGTKFTVDCKNGLCAPAIQKPGNNADSYSTEDPWEKANAFGADNSLGYTLSTGSNLSKSPRYIIEFLGPSEDISTTLYRVTARSWGKNANTEVTLQSVIGVTNK